jgi:hypothetical protein
MPKFLVACWVWGSLLLLGVKSVPVPETLDRFCRFPTSEVNKKEQLRQQSLGDNPEAQADYQALVQTHRRALEACREQNWPQDQAIWIRLYPCDLQPGALDYVFDRMVNLGYNQVFVEVFYDGRVLLPAAQNTTPWPSVISTPGYEEADLFAQAIEAGHVRGQEVYGWMFSMNFGYTYAQRNDRRGTLAENGRGETSLDLVSDGSQIFIDPYNRQVQADYANLVKQVLRRQPDGVLFDYIRYPRGSGAASVASEVQDLLIYSDASRQALLDRADNNQGRALIASFLQQGYVASHNINQAQNAHPQEAEPLWQGRVPNRQAQAGTVSQPILQQELWLLAVAHAQRGVLDFLNLAIAPAASSDIPAGAVFFPTANQGVGSQGFDSRLQPWPNFPGSSQWHPMAYSTCEDASCIVAEIQRVLDRAPMTTHIQPALAGMWDQGYRDRPSLAFQMDTLRHALPQLQAVSHFAYSWQYPEDDHSRKFCWL